VILLAHPFGNQNVRNAAMAFDEAGMLQEFWTCVSWDPDRLWTRLLPSAARTELERRAFPKQVRERIRTWPWRELGRQAAKRFGLRAPLAHESGSLCVDRVWSDLDARVARRLRRSTPRAVYAYEDGALRSFRTAAERGVRRVYELPIGYWRRGHEIDREERDLQPEWAPLLVGLRDSPEKLERKDEELALAERVVVPSAFVRASLAACPHPLGEVAVVPYGCPSPLAAVRSWSTDGPLRALYVGSLTQRKGLSYLFAAAERLRGAITLTVVGQAPTPAPVLERALARHRWLPTLPHAGVLEEMARHDVLVFPTLFEGFGLVLLEALSRGLPVITTPHSGSGDILTEGRDGFVVPIRDIDALVDRLSLLARDRERLAEMGRAALATAAAHSWERYRARLTGQLRAWGLP
jgi:glycosyltransferase involved in cell wall biosynthesis